MARKTETRDIGENTYRARQLKTRKANTVLERLLKIFGESLGALADSVGDGKTAKNVALVGDLKRGALSSAAQKLAKNLGGEDLNWLVEAVRHSVEYQTPALRESEEFVPMTADLWDDVFAGDILGQFQLLAWVLQLNYASFFAGAGGLASAARKFVTPTKSPSSSPTNPTSGSGDSSPPLD